MVLEIEILIERPICFAPLEASQPMSGGLSQEVFDSYPVAANHEALRRLLRFSL